MPVGNTKSSRIKICSYGIFASALLMLSPFVLALVLTGNDHRIALSFSFLAWVGLFLTVTFLTVLLSQLVKIEAEGSATGKLLGIEMPFEIRGVTVLLLGMYVILAFFYMATDLEGQLSAKRLHQQIDDLQGQLEDKGDVIAAFNAVHGGVHVEDVQMFRLSYHCGSNEARDAITEWHRYNIEDRTPDPSPQMSSVRPFPVGNRAYSYRVRFAHGDETFDESPLRVTAKLDHRGVLTAQIFIEEPFKYEQLWKFCSDPDGNFFPDDDASLADKADVN